MNQLIATLLDYPNLSLRLLDPNGRAIKTLNQDQLRRYVSQTCQAAMPDDTGLTGDKRLNHLN